MLPDFHSEEVEVLDPAMPAPQNDLQDGLAFSRSPTKLYSAGLRGGEEAGLDCSLNLLPQPHLAPRPIVITNTATNPLYRNSQQW